MEIVGYSDRLSIAPGESIRFMVGCARPTYRADLVRLIHGDETPGGPGFKERLVPSALDGDYPGRMQPIHAGSHLAVPNDPVLQLAGSLTLHAWIYPTLPGHGAQGIVTKWSAAQETGYALVLDERGCLALWLGGPDGCLQLSTDEPLRTRVWHSVAAAFDLTTRMATLTQLPVKEWPRDASRVVVTRRADLPRISQSDAPLLVAACEIKGEDGQTRPGHHFNGKIERPRLFARALSAAQIATLGSVGETPTDDYGLVAAWDFSTDFASARVTDRGPNGLHGRAVNMPARAMTGRNWTGRESNPALAPAEYGAIHFHEDDLEDAQWESDVALTAPADLPSGIYAARLRAGEAEDHLPFVVHPPLGTATASILMLVPTNTYLAYANFNVPPQPPALFRRQDLSLHRAEHQYMTDNNLLSLYDTHRDGSGVCYSSRLRPIVNMRPRFKFRDVNAAHNLPADLYLADWLEAKGHQADFATDEDLHVEGLARLRPYRVVVTGTHPEYWTAPMPDALQAYLADGGLIMYLGGNGFYWVTSFDPERPHVIEVRRWGGTEAWGAEPGEYHHSSTGELGGLWRNRGRAPQAMLGVGFTSQGFDRSAPYRRTPDSFDPRAAFIFDGIGDDELIGNVPALTLEHGAAGYEIDRADPALGTPPHALVLASSFGHSDSYQHVIEEVLMSDSTQGGSANPLVHADLVFFEGPSGGAVFSAGSIAWCGALSANDYDNTVSRITDNVLRRFASAEPIV